MWLKNINPTYGGYISYYTKLAAFYVFGGPNKNPYHLVGDQVYLIIIKTSLKVHTYSSNHQNDLETKDRMYISDKIDQKTHETDVIPKEKDRKSSTVMISRDALREKNW